MVKKILIESCSVLLIAIFSFGIPVASAQVAEQIPASFPFDISGQSENVLPPLYPGAPYLTSIKFYPSVVKSDMFSYAGHVASVEILNETVNKQQGFKLYETTDRTLLYKENEDFRLTSQSINFFRVAEQVETFAWGKDLQEFTVKLTAKYVSHNPQQGKMWDKVPSGKGEKVQVYKIPMGSFLQDTTSGEAENFSGVFKINFGKNVESNIKFAVENPDYQVGLVDGVNKLKLLGHDVHLSFEDSKYFTILGDSSSGWSIGLAAGIPQVLQNGKTYNMTLLEFYKLEGGVETSVSYPMQISIGTQNEQKINEKANEISTADNLILGDIVGSSLPKDEPLVVEGQSELISPVASQEVAPAVNFAPRLFPEEFGVDLVNEFVGKEADVLVDEQVEKVGLGDSKVVAVNDTAMITEFDLANTGVCVWFVFWLVLLFFVLGIMFWSIKLLRQCCSYCCDAF